MDQQTAAPCFYQPFLRRLESLRGRYPGLSVRVAGRSALGRGIFALSVGNPRRQALIVAGFGGSETAHCQTALGFIERLCRAAANREPLFDIDVGKALRDCGVSVLPCLNPDGIEIFTRGPAGAGSLRRFVRTLQTDVPWQANANGVELMRNFSSGWSLRRNEEAVAGVTGPAPAGFSGEQPEREAETAALLRLCRRQPFRQALALCGSGGVVRCGIACAPTGAVFMQKLLADCCGLDVGDNAADGVCCAFADRFTEIFARPALTMEPGKGDAPSPASEFDSVDERIAEALTLFFLM